MTDPALRVTPDASRRRLLIDEPQGTRWCTLMIGLPGEEVPGFEPGEGELLLSRSDAVETRVRLFDDLDSWTLSVSADNRGDRPVELPDLGLAVVPADGVSGWAWTTDLDGFIALAPPQGEGPVVVLRLRQGFLRAAKDVPAFASQPQPGTAFHLAPPHGTLGAFRRHQASLTIERRATLAGLGALLPAWLPEVIVDAGDEVEFRTPDEGVVGGPHMRVTHVDAVAVVGGDRPGHGAVSLHGVQGVRRVSIASAPRLEELVPPLVEVTKSRRPSSRSSGAGLLVAEAMGRGLCADPESALDWLEREDWLDRRDLESVAIAAVLAGATRDESLLADAWGTLDECAVAPGFGMVAMKLLLTSFGVSGGAPARVQDVLTRRSDSDLANLELALVARQFGERSASLLDGLINSLGDLLPGQSLGVSAQEAARRIGLLRLSPESWAGSIRAARCAEKAQRLLLADEAQRDHVDAAALGWLLLGELGI